MRTLMSSIKRNDSVNTMIDVVKTGEKTFKVFSRIGDESVWWSTHRSQAAAAKAAFNLHIEMMERYGE